MPHKKNPADKLNLWKLVKELIGKDLTRFALPGKY